MRQPPVVLTRVCRSPTHTHLVGAVERGQDVRCLNPLPGEGEGENGTLLGCGCRDVVSWLVRVAASDHRHVRRCHLVPSHRPLVAGASSRALRSWSWRSAGRRRTRVRGGWLWRVLWGWRSASSASVNPASETSATLTAHLIACGRQPIAACFTHPFSHPSVLSFSPVCSDRCVGGYGGATQGGTRVVCIVRQAPTIRPCSPLYVFPPPTSHARRHRVCRVPLGPGPRAAGSAAYAGARVNGGRIAGIWYSRGDPGDLARSGHELFTLISAMA